MSEEQSIIRETTYKQPASREETPATETIRAELQDINADTVLMNRSGSEDDNSKSGRYGTFRHEVD